MRKNSKGIAVFLISLFLSFCVLGAVFLLFLAFSKSQTADIKNKDIPYLSDYTPTSDQNLNILFLGCEEAESDIDFICLLKYDAPNGIINILTLPKNLLCTSDGRTDTISGHYNYTGVRGAVNAVKSLFSIEIERYSRIQKTGISNMADYIGGISYNVESAIQIDDEILYEGYQLLDGRRISSLIFKKDELGFTDLKKQSELIKLLIDENFDKSMLTKSASLASVIFYNCETNLNQYDFSKRQTGFENKLTLGTLVTKEVFLSGNLDEAQNFIADTQSIKTITAYFE